MQHCPTLSSSHLMLRLPTGGAGCSGSLSMNRSCGLIAYKLPAVLSMTLSLTSLGASSTSTPILLMHGGADRKIPSAASVAAQRQLTSAGYDVTLKTFPDVGHTISSDEARQAEIFYESVSFDQLPTCLGVWRLYAVLPATAHPACDLRR